MTGSSARIEEKTMSQITNLEGLFALAAENWDFVPIVPTKGGIKLGTVVSRTITVWASIVVTAGEFTAPDPAGVIGFELYYTPSRRVLIRGASLLVPAVLSGSIGGLSLSISASSEAAEDGFGVLVTDPGPTLSFTVPPPGGNQTQGPSPDPLVSISFPGDATIAGKVYSCEITLYQYSFQFTLQ
jgi:hypothetical protein